MEELGGSEYLNVVYERVEGQPPHLDLKWLDRLIGCVWI